MMKDLSIVICFAKKSVNWLFLICIGSELSKFFDLWYHKKIRRQFYEEVK